MDALPGAFAPMAAREQFVTWYALPSQTKPGKYDKIPCHWATGVACDAQAPANWTNAACALAMAPQRNRGYGSGAGFVFTAADPFFFLDIDGALQADGTWSPRAIELVHRFAGAAVEVSHSGRGLHVFGSYASLAPHGTRYTPEHLELYTSGRFVALTGTGAYGDAGHDCTEILAATAAQFFPPPAVTGESGSWTTEPVPEWSGPTDDDELVRRAHAAAARSPAAAFGGKTTFAHLWSGDVPDDGRSEADQSLANHLAFWTGKDCERIERLMRASGLARDKWDAQAHANYLSTTILKACAFVSKVATGPAQPPPAPAPAVPQSHVAPGTRDATREILGPWQQVDHFQGCTFISDHLRIYSLPRNKLMVREAFDVEYGGHLFVVDPTGQKTTDSAYMALTRSRVNLPPIVDDICFRPSLGAGEVVVQGSRRYLNTYVPHVPESVPGDASRWVDHLRRMYPVPGDVEVLLLYLAAITQRPGVKIPWWPVLQGTKGNGKTLILELMEHVNGEAYSHRPNAAALAKDGMKFNTWLERKTFVGFDEVSLAHKRDFLEELKAVVTGERIQFEGKGANQLMGDNAANGLILTNHPDGVPIDDDERRYAILYAAQQHRDHLARDGMTEDYFYDFRGWLKGIDGHAGEVPGFAVVTHYLQTYPLPARLPSRAPATSSRADAVRMSLGRAEQEILEAIEEGRPGFMGGWVSSKYLDALLDSLRVAVPRNKRRGMMQALGYDWHPALADGRVYKMVTPDNGKPKLYVRKGHLAALNITDPGQVADAYAKAQNIMLTASSA